MHTPTESKLLALLLPSKGRFVDLFLTLALTPLKSATDVQVIFIVCANYSKWQLLILTVLFKSRAVFMDERALPFKGMVGAYNYAYEKAKDMGAEWVALWADDLLPAKKDWLNSLAPIIQDSYFQFGIFSSDEGGHHNRYGYNIFGGYPCAHFYLARTVSLPGHLLNPKFRAYTGDNEIAISQAKRGIPIAFLPVRVIHQPTMNTTRRANAGAYKTDLDILYQLHPDMTGKLDAAVLNGNLTGDTCRYLAEAQSAIQFKIGEPYLSHAAFMTTVQPEALSPYFSSVWLLRRLWNQGVVLSFGKLYGFILRFTK